jgi:penicillin amidase
MGNWLLRIAAGALLLLLVGALGAWLAARASLPDLDGAVTTAAITAPLSVERDGLGTPTITAATRADAAFGLGYAHGQDRFFQMDLSRRLAAGELAELFGAVALEQDRGARRYRFREVARQVIADATPEQRAIISAYARGVNEGVAGLRSRPFEYWLLQSVPAAWRDEDSVLVVHAMWWDLQHNSILAEQRRRRLIALAPPALAAFLYPRGTPWDAPNEPVTPPPEEPRIPTAGEFDLRAKLEQLRDGKSAATAGTLPRAPRVPAATPMIAWLALPEDAVVGSNNWAVAGQHTAGGVALVANDMHLGLRVPAVWYRARLRVTGSGDDLIGVTLPGVPALVAGSNTHIAWGFTNSYGDWSDGRYLPCESAELTTVIERIAVKGAATVDLPIRVPRDPALSHQVVTREGDAAEGCLLTAWAARARGATTLGIFDFERARSVEQALAIAPSVGIPQQNLVVGDRGGRIAWSILGRVPRGDDADRLWRPVEWRGFDEHPRLVDPAVGRLWSANARSVDGPLETIVGADEVVTGVSYDFGARARQIRDALLALAKPATPADMLSIQLDDRAILLQRWRDFMVQLLDADAVAVDGKRAALRGLLEQWQPRADADAVGYRLVRNFNDRLTATLWQAILEAFAIDAKNAGPPRSFESVIWLLANARPQHFLPPEYADWRGFLLAEIDHVIAASLADCASLEACTWGAYRPVMIQHPLSRALPTLASLLDMPTIELAGDNDMPRVQAAAFGASERFAVSPGREADGYLQLPGGQSGHPLSPYYRAGFDEWAQGKPTPFLPGPTQHKLEFTPNAAR